MKKLIVLLCLMTTSAFAEGKQLHQFDRSYNNQMMIECLDAWGYPRDASVDDRMNWPYWREVSGCTANFVLEDQRKRVKADREFVNKHPWFKGKNWKWQERAEYTCRKITTLNGTFELCSKPIYLN
jgi:hypothetical protein